MTRRAADRAEALDPQTPAPRLAALMGTHLADVLRNPALPLLLVEQPDFWSLLPLGVRLKVARSERCPPEFVAWSLRQPAPDAVDLMCNRALPAASRRAAYARLPFGEITPDLADHLLEHTTFDFLSTNEQALVRWALEGPAVDAAACSRLVRLDGLGAWLALRQAACPSEALEWLLEHGDGDAATEALGHPNLSPELIASALETPEPAVRCAVAVNPSLTPAQRDQLARDPDERVRRSLR
jgi:hypothetical protein